MQLIKPSKACLLIVCLCGLLSLAGRSQSIAFNNAGSIVTIGKYLEILNNKNANYDEHSVLTAKEFYASKNDVPLFPVPDVNVWLRFSVTNTSSLQDIY